MEVWLDRHCVGCHGGENPKGGLTLTGGLTKMWNRSYENLTKKNLQWKGDAEFRPLPLGNK